MSVLLVLRYLVKHLLEVILKGSKFILDKKKRLAHWCQIYQFWVVTYHWCPTQPRTLFGRTTFLLPITIYQLLGGKTSSIKLNEPFECLVFIKTCFMWFNGVEICINCQSWSRSLLHWRLMGSRGLKLCIALKLGLLWTFISNSCTPPYQPPFVSLNAIYMDYKVQTI